MHRMHHRTHRVAAVSSDCAVSAEGQTQQNEALTSAQANAAWLLCASLLLLAVLVLDRFADYEGSHAVLPVRDAAAQALAWCAVHMRVSQQQALLRLLVRLQQAEAWEVCLTSVCCQCHSQGNLCVASMCS